MSIKSVNHHHNLLVLSESLSYVKCTLKLVWNTLVWVNEIEIWEKRSQEAFAEWMHSQNWILYRIGSYATKTNLKKVWSDFDFIVLNRSFTGCYDIQGNCSIWYSLFIFTVPIWFHTCWAFFRYHHILARFVVPMIHNRNRFIATFVTDFRTSLSSWCTLSEFNNHKITLSWVTENRTN